MTKQSPIALALMLIAAPALADLVVTKDGARLTGTITLIDKGRIHLDTPYAGPLEIDQSQVASFETEEPRFVRLQSGTVMAGPIQSSGDGKLKIRSEDGVLETDATRVAASWTPGAEDPEVVRNSREWRYEASLELTGRSGNTDKFNFGTNLAAELKGPDDTLALFFEYEQADTEGEKTEDRTAGGASYESFFSEIVGWYARTELEQDRIDDIDLRSTTGAGLSYRLIKKENQLLVARTGLGYEFTAYGDDSENESSATIDFGLRHDYTYKDVFEMENTLTYVPLLEDFGNYRLVHDSGIEIPIGSGENWKIRMGVKNEYESEPVTDANLDTTYYTRMIYAWD